MSEAKLFCKNRLVFDWRLIIQILWNSTVLVSSIKILDYDNIELCAFSIFGAVVDCSTLFLVLDCCTRLPIEAAAWLLSIPQARKRLPGLQTLILNCSKTLLPLLPIQINWKSCINHPLYAGISKYASLEIFMILGVVVWNGSWVFMYASCSYDLYPLIT